MNNYYCVLPFYGAEYYPNGYTSPCCLLPNDTNLTDLQAEILAGKRSTSCQKCWNLEDQGLTSDRQLKNSAYDFYADKDIRYVEEESRVGQHIPKIIKLYTSNVCNSTCVTCGPKHSSAWATLENQKTFEIINTDLIDSFDYSNIVILNFVGGEPLYEKTNFLILEKLISAGNTNCNVSITTNGSAILTQKQKDVLGQFKNLNINLSIDGIGPVFEYLRYPLKWNDLLDSIAFYRSLNIDLSVSYTISNLNVLYYQETINWFESMQLPYNHNIVTHPAYFHPGVLPKEVKSQHSNLATFFQGGNEELLNDFYNEIIRQDQLKGISIDDYLTSMVSSVAGLVAK